MIQGPGKNSADYGARLFAAAHRGEFREVRVTVEGAGVALSSHSRPIVPGFEVTS